METVDLEHQEIPRSHLFLVRVWQEQLDGDQTEWRGKIHAALSGKEQYFRDWDGLVTAISKLLETHIEAQPLSEMESDGLPKQGEGTRDD